MIKNYFLLAFRNFFKDIYYASVNLLGLAISFTAVILIVSFIAFQLSFDRFDNINQTYLLLEQPSDGRLKATSSVNIGLGNILKQEFQEIQQVAHFMQQKPDFKIDDDFISVNVTYTNSGFLKVFDLDFIEGNKETALTQPNQIVISKSVAKKIFGSEKNLLGKHFELNKTSFLISGIIKDLPENVSFDIEAIAFDKSTENSAIDWNEERYVVTSQFILLKPNTDVRQLEEKINHYYHLHNKEAASLELVPLKEIHFSSVPDIQSLFRTLEIRYLYILGGIGFLILVIACSNYVNLTIARSFGRTKEVGLRKTMGASRVQLAFQFIGESILFFCMALIPSFLLTSLMWPYFNSLVNTAYPLDVLFNKNNIYTLLLINFIASVLSGCYPAYYLARLNPTNALKGTKALNVNFNLKKVLIVGQYVISIFLMVATTVVFKQLNLLSNREYGFDKDYLLALPSANHGGKLSLFKQELMANSKIVSTTIANMQLGEKNNANQTTSEEDDVKLMTKMILVDIDFVNTLKLNLIMGRDFSSAYSLDINDWKKSLYTSWKDQSPSKAVLNEIRATRPIIVSQGLIESLQIKMPLGHVLEIDGFKYGHIVGVTSEFIGADQRKKNPYLILAPENNFEYVGTMYIRIEPDKIPETLKYIENTWKIFRPNSKFEFSFVDDRLQKMYDTENRLAKLLTCFSAVAIGISIMGLFSLISIMVRQRKKEIGIRKVMGAEARHITQLFSADFLRLLIIAYLISFPIAWMVMREWLADYAYRTEVSWWIFLLAGLLTICVTMLTIFLQTVRAARENPVESLRNE